MRDGGPCPEFPFHAVHPARRYPTRAQQLLQRQRLFEKIAATSPDLMYVCELLGRYTSYINPAVKRVLGYTPVEIAAMGQGVAGYQAQRNR